MTPNRRSFLAASAIAFTAGASTAEAEEKPGKTKNTKFAVNVEMWWRKEKDYLKRLEAAAALGFGAVELWPWENKDQNAFGETCERLGNVKGPGTDAAARKAEQFDRLSAGSAARDVSRVFDAVGRTTDPVRAARQGVRIGLGPRDAA